MSAAREPKHGHHLLPSIGGAENVCVFVRSLLDPDAHKLTALALSNSPAAARGAARGRGQAERPAPRGRGGYAAAGPGQPERPELLHSTTDSTRWKTLTLRRGHTFSISGACAPDTPFGAGRSRLQATMRLKRRTYAVPRAKQFGGLNDRLGLSSSAVARDRRVTVLLQTAAALKTDLDPFREPAKYAQLGAAAELDTRNAFRGAAPLGGGGGGHAGQAQVQVLPHGGALRPARQVPAVLGAGGAPKQANASLEVAPAWPADATCSTRRRGAGRVRFPAPVRGASSRPAAAAAARADGGRLCELLGALADSASLTAVVPVRRRAGLRAPAVLHLLRAGQEGGWGRLARLMFFSPCL